MKSFLFALSAACVSMVLHAQPSFSLAAGSPIALPSSTSMQGLVSGDLNNDGFKDIVVGNGYSNIYNILLGNGTGQFTHAPGSPMNVNSGPLYTAIADFNNDQVKDLATANYNTDNISIYLGNGNGSFSQAAGSPISTGYLPYSIDAADFNMDGNMDLITCSAGANLVFLFFGNGGGGFSPAITIPAGGMPYHVSAGKFNADNYPDIAFVNGTGNTLQVFINNGTGAFTQAAGSPYATGNEPRTIAIGDLNGDGFNDLSIPDETGGDLNIFFGSAGGAFTTAPGSPLPVFSGNMGPFQSVIADYDFDGHNDIAVSSSWDNSILILPGNGTGAFTQSHYLNVGSATHSMWGDDFNNDGKPDLAAAEWQNNHVRVFLNTGSNTTPCSLVAGISYSVSPNGNLMFNSTSTGTNPNTTYAWSFGDNATDQGASVSHAYTPGTYVVTLTASNGAACNSSATVAVTVSCSLNAGITYTVLANGNVSFSSASTGVNATTGYAWDFGDNTNGQGASVSHSYTPGSYIVTLTATNGTACSSTSTVAVTVASCSLASGITYSILPNGVVNFTSTSTGTNATTNYTWLFGDNTTAQGAMVSHTYIPGTYVIKLTVSDGNACAGSSIVIITIGKPVGIQNNQQDAEISVYPTPASDKLYVKVPGSFMNEALQLKVYSLLGTEVIRFTVDANNTQIDVSSLENGTYFYSLLQIAGQVKSGHLIIMH